MIMKKIIFSVIMLLMFSSFAFTDEDKHLAVDQAIGGMEQGSRISAPDAKGTAPLTDIHKTISSSQGTKKAEPSAVTISSNHGNIYSAPGQTSNPVNTGITGSESTTGQTGTTETGGTESSGTGETGSGQVTNPIDTGGVSQPETEPITHPIDSGVGTETLTEEPSTGTGGSTQEDTSGTNEHPMGTGGSETGSSETSGNPIVDIGAGVDLESGTVETDVTVDITGELEEKEIFEADLEAEGVGSIDADVTSAADMTGEEVIKDADVTTDTITQTVQPVVETVHPAEQTGPAESPPTESTQESNPIVGADVNVNPESGTVEGGVTVDTSGELEERQIIDADVTAAETAAETEVGSATDVTQSDIVESADITTQSVQKIIPIPSDLTAEVDTTGETSGGEADVGVEADVSGISEGEDVTCDPADALTSAACGIPQL